MPRAAAASGLAQATSRPAAMSATVSHSSASVTIWVVTMRLRPASRSRRSSVQIARRTIGSIPPVGSSRKTSCGSWISAQPSCSRRRIPPDRCTARRERASSSSSHCRIALDPPPTPGKEHPEQAADEVEVLGHGEVVVERHVLGHEADPLAGVRPEACRVLAHDAGRAAGRPQTAGEQPDRGRLAGSARPDDPDKGAWGDGEADVVECDDLTESSAGCAQLRDRLRRHRHGLERMSSWACVTVVGRSPLARRDTGLLNSGISVAAGRDRVDQHHSHPSLLPYPPRRHEGTSSSTLQSHRARLDRDEVGPCRRPRPAGRPPPSAISTRP